MSYDTVKNGIAGLMLGLGYQESLVAFDFENASSREYGNTFIIKALNGLNDEDNSETLSDRFYDIQEWEIQVAFEKSENNDVINRDDMHRKKDSIIAVFDKPSNWTSYVRLQKYKTWQVEDLGDYFLLTVTLKVVDTYTYS